MAFQNGHESKNGNSQNGGGGYYLGSRFTGTSSQSSNNGELLDIKKFVSLFISHKWLILSFTIVGIALAVYRADNTTPVYQSTGTMYIMPNDQQGNGNLSGSQITQMIANQFNVGGDGSIAMQVEFLKSRKLIDEVAQQMMAIKYRPDGSLYPILWQDYPTDSSLVSMSTLVTRISEGLSVQQQESAGGFTIPGMMHISFNSYDPYEASRIVNMVMNSYVDLSLKQNREVAQAANKFLEKEKNKVKNQLFQSEADLSQFMSKKKMVSLNGQTNQLISTLSNLESQRQSIDIQQTSIQSAIDSYKKQLESIKPGLAKKVSEGIGTTLNSYQYQLADLQTRKSLILSQNPALKNNEDSEPELRSINGQIKVLRSEIQELTTKLLSQGDDTGLVLGNANGGILSEVSTLRQKLMDLQIQQNQNEARKRALGDQISILKEQFNKVPDNMMELAQLKRKVSMNENLYTTLAQQSAQMSLNEQLQASQGRIIDSADRPSAPVIPNKPKIILIGFALGLMFPVGFLFIREVFVNKINSIDKLKKKGLPVLSVIPEMTGEIRKLFSRKRHISVDGFNVSTFLLTHLESISPISEAFRRLHSNVIYSQPDNLLKVLMFTSSHKGEGKTTVLSNFGVTLAEAGKRILILDADFRRPGIAKLFGVSREPGILEHLFEDAPLADVIQKSSVEGVDVLVAGKIAPNPASLSKSNKLRQLILELRDRYDHVLLDTAPYGMITDAAPLMHLSDGVILIAKFNDTRETEIGQTIESLQRTQANILGTVLTSYNPKKSTDHYYHKEYYKSTYTEYSKYHEDSKKKKKKSNRVKV